MRVIKPHWVNHDGMPIFSVDVHPDGSKFVTGGQGKDSGLVAIWNFSPVISHDSELDENTPKILCQMDSHLACVNSVRWSWSGKLLASGGDDKLIMIWKYAQYAHGNNVYFGSRCKMASETWRCAYTLHGHTGDVLDLAWSPHDIYLASGSVDNSIIVWNASKFPEIVITLKNHSGLVKGVAWDPVGKYLSSQSEDKSLRIWNTSDWHEEVIISKPFRKCSGTTAVLRHDWSPDGQYLVTAHAMNNSGPTSLIVERDTWKHNKDYVGHRKAIACVRFSNSIVRRSIVPNGKLQEMCLCALGSRDSGVSVWLTGLLRPVVVVEGLFHGPVLDLSWSPEGNLLLACSFDGSVAAFIFRKTEIGTSMSNKLKDEMYQKRYGTCTFTSLLNNSQIIENPDMLKYISDSPKENKEKPVRVQRKLVPVCRKAPVTTKQLETRTKDGRRRITPIFIPPVLDEYSEEAVITVSDENDKISTRLSTTKQDRVFLTVNGKLYTIEEIIRMSNECFYNRCVIQKIISDICIYNRLITQKNLVKKSILMSILFTVNTLISRRNDGQCFLLDCMYYYINQNCKRNSILRHISSNVINLSYTLDTSFIIHYKNRLNERRLEPNELLVELLKYTNNVYRSVRSLYRRLCNGKETVTNKSTRRALISNIFSLIRLYYSSLNSNDNMYKYLQFHSWRIKEIVFIVNVICRVYQMNHVQENVLNERIKSILREDELIRLKTLPVEFEKLLNFYLTTWVNICSNTSCDSSLFNKKHTGYVSSKIALPSQTSMSTDLLYLLNVIPSCNTAECTFPYFTLRDIVTESSIENVPLENLFSYNTTECAVPYLSLRDIETGSCSEIVFSMDLSKDTVEPMEWSSCEVNMSSTCVDEDSVISNATSTKHNVIVPLTTADVTKRTKSFTATMCKTSAITSTQSIASDKMRAQIASKSVDQNMERFSNRINSNAHIVPAMKTIDKPITIAYEKTNDYAEHSRMQTAVSLNVTASKRPRYVEKSFLESMTQHSGNGSEKEDGKILPPLKLGSVVATPINERKKFHVNNETSNTTGPFSHIKMVLHDVLLWDYIFGFPVVGFAFNEDFVTVALGNRSLYIIKIDNGKFMSPPLTLSSDLSYLTMTSSFLLCVTCDAIMNIWDLTRRSIFISNRSLEPVITTYRESADAARIKKVILSSEGIPTILLSAGKSYVYSLELSCWLIVGDNSDPVMLCELHKMNRHHEELFSLNRNQLPLYTLQTQFSSNAGSLSKTSKTSSLCALTFLQRQVSASLALKSPHEYRYWLLTLTRYLLEQGEQKRLRMICEDLMGAYKAENTSSILGLSRRSLLNEILQEIGSSVTSQRLFTELNDQLNAFME